MNQPPSDCAAEGDGAAPADSGSVQRHTQRKSSSLNARTLDSDRSDRASFIRGKSKSIDTIGLPLAAPVGDVGITGSVAVSSVDSISGDRLLEAKPVDKVEPWIESVGATLFFGAVIAVNSIVTGIDVEVGLRYGQASVPALICYAVSCLLLVVFVVELVIRLRTYGVKGTLFFNPDGTYSPANFFDAVVVAISVIDLWIVAPVNLAMQTGEGSPLAAFSALRILQLLRLVRIVRLFRVSRELYLLLRGLAMSLRQVFWVFLLLLVVMYIGALFCASELGRSDNPHLRSAFGSIGSSLFSHFKLMTLEQWPDISAWAMEESTLWAFYFIGYIALTNLALVNLVTGLVMDGVVKNSKENDWSSEEHAVEALPFLNTLRQLVRERAEDTGVGFKENGELDEVIDRKRWSDLISDTFFQQVLALYDISLRIPPDHMFNLLDEEGTGTLTIDELAANLLQLRGSREFLHPLLVRDDLQRESRSFVELLGDQSQEFVTSYESSVSQFEASLNAKLQEFEHIATSVTTALGDRCASAAAAEHTRRDGDDDDDDGASVSSEDPLPRPPPMVQTKEPLAPNLAAVQSLDAQIAQLVRDASIRARALDSDVRLVEAELRASLHKEKELKARVELSLATTSATTFTQTEAEVVDTAQGLQERPRTPVLDRSAVDAAIATFVARADRDASATTQSRDSFGEGSYCPPPRVLAAMSCRNALVRSQRKPTEADASSFVDSAFLQTPDVSTLPADVGLSSPASPHALLTDDLSSVGLGTRASEPPPSLQALGHLVAEGGVLRRPQPQTSMATDNDQENVKDAVLPELRTQATSLVEATSATSKSERNSSPRGRNFKMLHRLRETYAVHTPLTDHSATQA